MKLATDNGGLMDQNPPHLQPKAPLPLDLSLFQIEEGLLQLIEYREARLRDTDDPPGCDELQAIEAEIQKYEIAGPAKVSRVAGIVRWWRAKKAIVQQERARLAAVEASLESMETRLKERVGEVLRMLPMPAENTRVKSRKLEGADGSVLMLKGNGGVQALEVNAELLPEEFKDVLVKIPLSLWRDVNEYLPPTIQRHLPESVETAPANERIRAALAKPCGDCGGLGCTGDSSGEGNGVVLCPACGGSKLQGVPGARLLPRGDHVEIR